MRAGCRRRLDADGLLDSKWLGRAAARKRGRSEGACETSPALLGGVAGLSQTGLAALGRAGGQEQMSVVGWMRSDGWLAPETTGRLGRG